MPQESVTRSCEHKDRRYAHGSIMCEGEICRECNDGSWQKKTDWSAFPSCISEDESLPGGPDQQWKNLK